MTIPVDSCTRLFAPEQSTEFSDLYNKTMLEDVDGSPDRDIQLHSNMEWLMERYPGVVPLLVRKRMACVGCCMAVFDSVEDAARYHGLDAAQLLADLRAIARKTIQPLSDSTQ